MEAGASGDIAIALMRRNGTIGIPVYLWVGGVWVDFPTLTVTQWNTYVDARLAVDQNPNGIAMTTNPDNTITKQGRKVDGLTISKVQF